MRNDRKMVSGYSVNLPASLTKQGYLNHRQDPARLRQKKGMVIRLMKAFLCRNQVSEIRREAPLLFPVLLLLIPC